MDIDRYYNDIPIRTPISRFDLATLWGVSPRTARGIISKLRSIDNGDNYVIVSSSDREGYYRTDNPCEISRYMAETKGRAINTFLPLKKAGRILNKPIGQMSAINNVREVRMARNMSAVTLAKLVHDHDQYFDAVLLSKIENDRCAPTPAQVSIISNVLGCSASEVYRVDLYTSVI